MVRNCTIRILLASDVVFDSSSGFLCAFIVVSVVSVVVVSYEDNDKGQR